MKGEKTIKVQGTTIVVSRADGTKALRVSCSTGTLELEFTQEQWTALAESAQWHWINAEQIAREQRESSVVEVSHEVVEGVDATEGSIEK